MGTSAPAVREHDIPGEEPYKPPKALPEPDKKRWLTPTPATQPVREPVPVRRESEHERK